MSGLPGRSPLEQALELHQRGLVVIPVPRPRRGAEPGTPGDGKVPGIKWGEFQERRPTEEELRAWFAAPHNLAVVTGRLSGVVAVDTDTPEALRWCTSHLPYTPWQTKTAKGFHLWYQHPGIAVRNRARIETRDGKIAVDVRGDGGFVVAPGSLHASGAWYIEAGNWLVPRSAVPTFWPGWLAKPREARRETPRPPRCSPGGDTVERARKYLAAIAPPEIGCGSDAATLSAACRLVRGFCLSEADAEDLLWEWAGGRPGWTRAWVRAKVHNAVKYGAEPVGGLL